MPEIGQTLSHFRLVEKIGQGGMGEVYLADDMTLDRKVALKFLPEAFTSDPERMARFEREAKLLASLNHPNIAGIYGLEQADGNRFLVLEYVEGETLQARLSKGVLPLEDALALCRQIAEGLEAAHEKGVIHRDLKPANVMITAEEKVKILDFGLAKAFSDETQSIDSSQSPTLTEAMTQPGVILGTAAYMSPEQAKGKSVDKRADIWAFGCIFYECLTGKRPFEGETVTETLAAILRGEPDWMALTSSIPQDIGFVLRRCLEKDPGRRLRDTGDLRILMEEPVPTPLAAEMVRGRTSRFLVPGLTLLCLALVCGLAYWWYTSTRASIPSMQPKMTFIPAPAEAISAFHQGFALSPDGQTLLFSARTADGPWLLWKRRLADPYAQPIAGTENGTLPFWSPDGNQIAFKASGELCRMPAEGGQIQTIWTKAGDFMGGSWGDNNQILFASITGSRTAIFRVPVDRGTPVEIPGLGDGNVVCPYWLPGSRAFLFCRFKEYGVGHIYVASLEGKQQLKHVLDFKTGHASMIPGFFFSPPGYLFFNQAGALSVQKFEPESLSVSGKPVAITDIAGAPGFFFALTAARDEMSMIMRSSKDDTGNPGDPMARLKWINRKGEIVGELGPPRRYWTLRLSPDGSQAVVNPDHDLWIVGSGNRPIHLTSGPLDEHSAVWSPDGTKIAYSISFSKISIKTASQGGQEVTILDGINGLRATDWSPDSKYLLLNASPEASENSDILLYDFNAQKTEPWLANPNINEGNARFSPKDGKWVLYTSDEDGHSEVYLRPFKGGETKPVSSAGGKHPAWRNDGREIFYLSPQDELMAVSVANLDGNPEIGRPQRLFKPPINDLGPTFSQYDVAPDGQRFLMNIADPPQPLLYVQGIEELLKRGQ